MNILLTICARGGSKGVKNKNIRLLAGKPLIAHTIAVAKKWGAAERIVCSTDSEEIAAIAREYGAETPFLRPAELATDAAAKLPVIQHAVKFCEEKYGVKYDVVVDLDPTAPIRKVTDLDGAFSKLLRGGFDVVYSVCEARKNPYFNMVELDETGGAYVSKPLDASVVRRQDSPRVYDMNASIYVYSRDFLLSASRFHSGKASVYVMDDISAFDIDREIDFKFIEFLIERGFAEL